jgi:hypothetical protein
MLVELIEDTLCILTFNNPINHYLVLNCGSDQFTDTYTGCHGFIQQWATENLEK